MDYKLDFTSTEEMTLRLMDDKKWSIAVGPIIAKTVNVGAKSYQLDGAKGCLLRMLCTYVFASNSLHVLSVELCIQPCTYSCANNLHSTQQLCAHPSFLYFLYLLYCINP